MLAWALELLIYFVSLFQACYNKTDKVPEGYDLYAMAHTASYKQVKGKARKGEEFNLRQPPYNPEQVMISSGGRSRGSIAIDPKIAPETTVSLIWMDVLASINIWVSSC